MSKRTLGPLIVATLSVAAIALVITQFALHLPDDAPPPSADAPAPVTSLDTRPPLGDSLLPMAEPGPTPTRETPSPRTVLVEGESLIGSQDHRIRYCYDVAQEDHPDLTANLSVSVLIEPSGRASEVEVEARDPDVGTKELVACVDRQLRGTRWPKADTRRAIDGYTVQLSSI